MTAMNILLCLVIAMLGFSAAQEQGEGNEVWTEEELDANFSNAASDATAPTPVVIANHNYSSEIHHVTTTDGYVLELHRIPGSPTCPPASGKPVAFVVHGILSSSADWIVQGPKGALAYILADAGYDVWLGNTRGNTYSRKYIPTVSRKKFWDFTFHEIGYYDLPAMIDYVLDKTGQKQVVYIGHSQGATTFFVMTSMRPENNDKIKAMFALGPPVFIGDMFNPLARAAFTGSTLPHAHLVANIFGVRNVFHPPRFARRAGVDLCSDDFLARTVCRNILFLVGGFDKPQLDDHLLPMIFGHFPAGSSVHQFAHYGQEIQSGKFRQYDYGKIENRIRYGSETPPDYNLSSITAPVHLYYGENDWLIAETGVTQLYHELGNSIEMFLVPWKQWEHFDYIYGRDAKTFVYKRIIDTLANSYGLPSSCS